VHALRRKFMLYRSGMTPQSRGGYSAPPLDLDNEWVAVIGAMMSGPSYGTRTVCLYGAIRLGH
jgi:hypothetical protein